MLLRKEISDTATLIVFRMFLTIVYCIMAVLFIVKQYQSLSSQPIYGEAAIAFLLIALSMVLPLTRFFQSFKNQYLVGNVFVVTSIVVTLLLYITIYVKYAVASNVSEIYLSFTLCLLMQLPIAYLVKRCKQ